MKLANSYVALAGCTGCTPPSTDAAAARDAARPAARAARDATDAAAPAPFWPNCTFRLRSFRFPNGTKRVQSNS